MKTFFALNRNNKPSTSPQRPGTCWENSKLKTLSLWVWIKDITTITQQAKVFESTLRQPCLASQPFTSASSGAITSRRVLTMRRRPETQRITHRLPAFMLSMVVLLPQVYYFSHRRTSSYDNTRRSWNFLALLPSRGTGYSSITTTVEAGSAFI